MPWVSILSDRQSENCLFQLGLCPEILTLQWPGGENLSASKDFETLARRLRYQALGRACAEHCIESLAMAHHSDDQAETILMRLANNGSWSGLDGIQEKTRIPECWGLHGVHDSGAAENASRRNDEPRSSRDYAPSRPLAEKVDEVRERHPLTEHGNVHLLRPLLSYSKSHLVQTCRANSIEWEEDVSNRVVSLTMRNAIRSLLTKDRLPEALRKPSILSLHDNIHKRNMQRNFAAECMLNEASIKTFELRGGLMVVRFPIDVVLPNLRPGSQLENSVSLSLHTGAKFLASLAECVSPFESVSPEKFKSVVDKVFPGSIETDEITSDYASSRSFNAGGVVFKCTESRMSDKEALKYWEVRRAPGSLGTGDPTEMMDKEYIWTLSRQPRHTIEPYPEPWVIPAAHRHQASPSSAWATRLNVQGDLVKRYGHWSPWQLFDGRYWIRVLNRTSKPVVVRWWREDEVPTIRENISPRDYKRLHDVLGHAAPAKLRFTLPVIAEADSEPPALRNDDGLSQTQRTVKGRILGLPTLGKVGHLKFLKKGSHGKVQWEVRYKAISLRLRGTEENMIMPKDTEVRSWQD